MIEHVFQDSFFIRRPLEEAFSFFSDAENLDRITPENLGFRILTPKPIKMCKGTRIDYTIRLLGFPLQWKTLIAVWNPPHEFVDEQIGGPYRKWVHRHRFIPEGDGVRIEDHVTYALWLSPLGDIAFPWVRRQIEQIFAHRKEAIMAILESERPG